MATAPVRKKLTANPSFDLQSPYPMNGELLGHALVINTLSCKLPQTVVDAEAVSSALETVGFTVTQYDDCDVEEMRRIKDHVTTESLHVTTNCLFIVILCHKIQQGWLRDRYGRRAFTIEQLTSSLRKVRSLKEKPKVLLVQEAKDGSEEETEEIPVLHNKEDFYIVCATSDSESEDRSSYIQDFAQYLREHYLKEPLGRIFAMTKESQQVPVQISPTLKDKELMTLAGKISTEAMRVIAVEKLDIDYEQVKTLADANRENHQFMKFEILRKWKNMSQKVTRQKLAAILQDTAGLVDSKVVDKVLQTGEMGEHGIRQFDSFTHTLYFSEFYKEKSAVAESVSKEEPEINSHVASQLQVLQETIQELKREKATQEASRLSETDVIISKLEEKLQMQEQKIKELETKQKEEAPSSVTEDERNDREETFSETESVKWSETSSVVSHEEVVSMMEKKWEEKVKELEAKIKEQTRRPVTLTLNSTHSTNLENWSSFTVMPSTGQIVVYGQTKKPLIGEAKWCLHVYTLAGKTLKHNTIKSPCQHYCVYLLDAHIEGQELLALSCPDCRDIKLLNLDTQQETKAYDGYARSMCHGDSSSLFVRWDHDCVKELNTSSSTFSLIQSLNTGIKGVYAGMCYVPSPHRYLVFSSKTTVHTISGETGEPVFEPVSGQIDGREMDPYGLIFLPQHGALLVADNDNGRILVLDPCNGDRLQIINLPNMGEIHDIKFCKDEIYMLHYIKSKYKMSIFRVK